MSIVHLALWILSLRPFCLYLPLLGSVCTPLVVCIRVDSWIRILPQCMEIMPGLSISGRPSTAVLHSTIWNVHTKHLFLKCSFKYLTVLYQTHCMPLDGCGTSYFVLTELMLHLGRTADIQQITISICIYLIQYKAELSKCKSKVLVSVTMFTES